MIVAIAVGAGIVELLEPDDDQQRRDLGDVGHVAGDEDHRAVFADGAGEGEREAGQHAPAAARGRTTRDDGLAAVGAERGRGLLDLAVELLQHRLHGAHDEGQADEDQRDEDAERRVGDLDAERRRASCPIQPFGA